MRIRSGYLSSKVTIQKTVTGQDESGQPVNKWANVATVWANVTDISGSEFTASAAVQNTAQTKITIRYRSGIAPAMRIVDKTNNYNIEAVLRQDGESLLLMCSRGAGHG
jgi:SPP1 family predicted phage head-tail adaptor